MSTMIFSMAENWFYSSGYQSFSKPYWKRILFTFINVDIFFFDIQICYEGQNNRNQKNCSEGSK